MPAQTNLESVGTMPFRLEEGKVLLVDQRYIPEKLDYFDATKLDDMCFAIKHMVVRGAPAIGIAAALCLAACARLANSTDYRQFIEALTLAKLKLDATRPTAINLRWATEVMLAKAKSLVGQTPVRAANSLQDFAVSLMEENLAANKSIGDHGATLLSGQSAVLTHCNTGPLACGGWGTAFGVIKSAALKGIKLTVYATETRPRQQGARLTCWELLQDGIEPTLITDSMAGHLMSQGMIDYVFVGADRIAANGDTANKIGTYSLAVLARYHKIPFYVCAPLSTVDRNIQHGKDIPIEDRDLSEVTVIDGKSIAPHGTKAINPAFDVTPNELISGIVTEKGVLKPPYEKAIASL